MSRAEAIRKRAEAQRIIVTCSSGNEYVIGKASLSALALVGELAIPKRLAEQAIGPQSLIEELEANVPDEVRAQAEAARPEWVRSPQLRQEIEQTVGQILGLSEFLRRYVYDPQILPDNEEITDLGSQVHESDVAGDVEDLVSYITEFSGGMEVEKLKPFPGRRISDSARSPSEAVRAETVNVDEPGAQSVCGTPVRSSHDETGSEGGE